MSGSDRGLSVQKRRPRASRLMRTGVAGRDVAADDVQVAARELRITRALAVEALGGDTVLFAERLRAKGWSVRGIARHLAREETVIAALFGVGVGG